MVCRYFMSGTRFVAAADRGFDVVGTLDGDHLQLLAVVEPDDDLRGEFGFGGALLFEHPGPDALGRYLAVGAGLVGHVAETRVAEQLADVRRWHALLQ